MGDTRGIYFAVDCGGDRDPFPLATVVFRSLFPLCYARMGEGGVD